MFAISAAIAGFAGALFGILLGSGSTMDFQMLAGLPYLLLAMVGGIAVVSGAILGGVLFQGFTWLTEIFPGVTVLVYWMRIGPGLAGIGIGYQPEGAIPQDRRRAAAPRRARQRGGQPPRRATIDAPETRPVPAPGA